jgi:D-lactate dehydrogenase (cytochrome)
MLEVSRDSRQRRGIAMLSAVETGAGAAPSHAVVRAIAALRERLGEAVATGEALRRQHANAVTWHAPQLPDAVVFAGSSEDVQAVVGICAAHRVPLVPFGTGTSLEGQVNAPQGGISLDLSRMNRILAVNADDLDCTVEAGVTRVQLNTHLRDQGLFFPVDPGADASLGGMAATRASGTNAVRYGTMRENVIRLAAVMPDGRLMRTAGRARKSAAGYDLTRLLVGSEGTLGVITEVTLRLHGIPESTGVAVCPFATLEGACATAISAIQAGLPVARVELLDEVQIRASNLYSKLSLPEQPHLFVEFHGSAAGVAEQAAVFEAIARDWGALDFAWAAEAEERTRLWKARNDVAWASLALRPGASVMATDVCVPISRLAECVLASKADLAASDLLGMVVGHVGDGNFHVAILFDPNDPAELGRVKAFGERLALRAIELDGTCTGEHGVGQGKMAYLAAEFGDTLDVMRTLKAALDPLGIMNPGKILPPSSGAVGH